MELFRCLACILFYPTPNLGDNFPEASHLLLEFVVGLRQPLVFSPCLAELRFEVFDVAVSLFYALFGDLMVLEDLHLLRLLVPEVGGAEEVDLRFQLLCE